MRSELFKECFVKTCLQQGEKKAIGFLRDGKEETELSYLDLDRDSNRAASVFSEMGIKKGDRAILFLEKSLAIVVAHLGLQKLGAISVPLNPGFKRTEMEYLLADADPQLVLAGPEQETMLKQIALEVPLLVIDPRMPYQDQKVFRSTQEKMPHAEILPEDAGLIIYTSGTTGKPKGAVLTQENLVHDAKNIINIWEISESDVLCHALPLFHVHGLCFALHTALMAGARVLMLDQFSPEKVVEVLAAKEGKNVCTLFMAVPSMYGKILGLLEAKTRDFSHIRLWTSGSAPLLVKDFDRIKRVLGKEPVEREGMSETGMNFSNPVHGVRKPGSIGVPLPDLQVRIVDPETLLAVEPGEIGELWLKGRGITPGYWGKPDETREAFVDGWFRTGDLGRVDDEGYYYLADRMKHIIISGGENISPKEVEGIINQMDGVLESSVVGIPDQKWGEKVVAAVVAKPESKIVSGQIQDLCREHLHNWKCPKEIVLVKELPKNTMGKVLKEEVKKLFGNSSRNSI